MNDKKTLENCPERLLDEPVEIRLAWAKALDSSAEVLKVLAKDRFWYVRDFVASNINTPRECLEILCNDIDFRVRGEAERTLIRQVSGVEFENSSLKDIISTAESLESALQDEKDVSASRLNREDIDL